ncbi:UNVERIFIED_ORG: hypothetical protein HNP28_003748 [Comamonas terrigena]
MSELHKEAAKRRGQARTEAVEARVREAMETIQIEMKANDGIYPKNGGAVSMNEVARRASISETTLFSPKQKELGKQVKSWIISLKKKEIVGRIKVQRTNFERSEAWRIKFLNLQDSHIATELELHEAEALLKITQNELKQLQEKYNILLKEVSSKVTSFVTRVK